MNNKAQASVGLLIAVGIGVIVALVMFQAAAQEVGKSTTTETITNALYTGPASGSCIDLKGQEILSTPVVTNRTDGVTIPATNYTISERVSSVDNLKRIGYCTKGTFGVGVINVTYTYGPEGYAEDSATRSIVGIIVLLGAIAIAISVMPAVRSKFE